MQKYKCKSWAREELLCYQPMQGSIVPLFSVVYTCAGTGHKGSVQLDLDDALRLRAQLDEFVRIVQPLGATS